MPPLLLALALAPSAPAPPPRPARPPLTRAELAGAYSGTWCGLPISFTLAADGRFRGFFDGHRWAGTYSLRGGVVCVRERPAADPGFPCDVRWWFRPARGPGGGPRRHGHACRVGAPPGENAP